MAAKEKKFGHRRRDNPISVYFQESVRETIEELALQYGAGSRSRIVEIMTRYGIEQALKSKAAREEFEKSLLSGL